MRVEFIFTKSMQPIVEAVGYDLALTLVARFGGTELRIPRHPDERDAIAQCIGVEAATRLAETFSSGRCELPRCAAWLQARRDEEISVRYNGGETQAELARRFRLTERHIRRILREYAQYAEIAAAPQAATEET